MKRVQFAKINLQYLPGVCIESLAQQCAIREEEILEEIIIDPEG